MKPCHALNYSVACLPDLLRFADCCTARGWAHSSLGARTLAATIEKAQHFVLPDGGRLLEDGLRGLRGRKARLPFPSITLEYFTDQEESEGTPCTRRVAVANETSYEVVDRFAAAYGNRRMPRLAGDAVVTTVNAVSWLDNLGAWIPQAMTLAIGETWDEALPAAQIIMPWHPAGVAPKPTAGRAQIAFWPLPLLPEIVNECIGQYGQDEGARQLVHDVSDESTAVLELCEALTCVNVRATKLQEVSKAVNDRRAAAGKMRLPDAWCLTIEVPAEVQRNGPWQGGTHRSPRTHLRRGHIRRLDSGNVWVNSTIVGSGKTQIDKHYHLERA